LRNENIGITIAVITNKSIGNFNQSKGIFILTLVKVKRLEIVQYAIVNILMEASSNVLFGLGHSKLQAMLSLVVYFTFL
jgi:hypothetical protein